MVSRTFLGLGFVLGFSFFLSLQCPALDTTLTGTLTLAWDPSPDPSVTGYRLYQGGESQIYTNVVDVGSEDTATIAGLSPDVTYYFAVTAYDTTGLESAFSGEISYTVPTNAVLPPCLVANLGLAVNAFGQAMVSGTAPAGYVFSVLVTDDFASWTMIGTVTADESGALQFTDPLSPFYSNQFYRFQQISTQSPDTSNTAGISPKTSSPGSF